MRSIGFVFAAALFTVSAAQAQDIQVVTEDDGVLRPSVFAPTPDNDLRAHLAKAKAEGKRLVLVWQGVGDPDSETLMRENYTTPRLVEYATQEYRLVTLNFFGDTPVTAPDGTRMTEMDLAVAQEITLLPTTVFFDDAGKEMFRLDGVMSPRYYFAGLMFVGSGEYTDDQYRGMFVRWSRANSARWRAIFRGEEPLPQ